jgi:hypothetical protein
VGGTNTGFFTGHVEITFAIRNPENPAEALDIRAYNAFT